MNSAFDNFNIVDVAQELAATIDHAEYSRLSTADIETAAQSLAYTLAVIRRALNARRRINTLPLELLIRIFSFVPEVAGEVNPIAQDLCGPYEIRTVWDLCPIIKVCHLWRTVALDVSALWSSVFLCSDWEGTDRSVLRHPKHTNLDSCKSGPMHLYLEDSFRHGQAVGPFGGAVASSWSSISKLDGVDVEALLRRVCEMHLKVRGGWDTVEAISQPPSLSLPWSALEHLVVSCDSIYNEPVHVWNGELMLFKGQTLHLRSLVLLNTPFLPSNTISSTLTRLFLFYNLSRSWAPASPDTTIPLPDILRFLSRTPALEELFISGIPESSSTERGPSLPCASLTQMRKLSIQAWNYDSNAPGISMSLLSHLILPQNCFVRLHCGQAEQMRLLALYLSCPRWDYTGAKVHCCIGTDGGFEGFGFSLQATEASGSGGIRIDVHAKETGNDLVAALRTILSVPLFAQGGALWISGRGIDDTQHHLPGLIPALATMSSIRELYVVQEDGYSTPIVLLESLGTPMWEVSDATHCLPFPNITTLYAFITIYDDSDYLRWFARMLRARSIQGCASIPRLLFGTIRLGSYDDEGVLQNRELIQAAVGEYTEELVILEDRAYWESHALSVLLPSICTQEGGWIADSVWPAWIEGQDGMSNIVLH